MQGRSEIVADGARGPDFRRAAGRLRLAAPGRTTWHSFSFGPHYDPANLGFGALVAHAEDLVGPGAGYPEHTHRDVEIVTWVVSGTLTHTQPDGRRRLLGPGVAQAISAGAGMVHAETVPADGVPTRFVQAWLRPDRAGGESSWETAQPDVPADRWVPVASGDRAEASLRLRCAATLWVGRPLAGRLPLPEAPRLHLFVTTGRVRLGEWTLDHGDAVRLTGGGGLAVAAEPGPTGGESGETRPEVLLWEMR